jgi:hypothetical protein
VAEWLRQGPAKPCTRVRFPPPPRAISSVGERYLDTVEATGSIPVSPTTFKQFREGFGVHLGERMRPGGMDGIEFLPFAVSSPAQVSTTSLVFDGTVDRCRPQTSVLCVGKTWIGVVKLLRNFRRSNLSPAAWRPGN